MVLNQAQNASWWYLRVLLNVVLMSFVLGCGELPEEGATEDGADRTDAAQEQVDAVTDGDVHDSVLSSTDAYTEPSVGGSEQATSNTKGLDKKVDATQTSPRSPNAYKRLSADPRTAIQLEAYYALSPRHDGTSNVPPIGGMAIGEWNYLANDLNAYNAGKRTFRCYSSLWTRYGTCVLGLNAGPFKIMGDNNFYDSVDRFGFYGGRGHGGQCLYFTWLLFYRSGVQFQLPNLPARSIPVSYGAVRNDYNGARLFTKPTSQARIGDILYNPNEWHTTTVVGILGGVAGQSVSAVDVIDSNFITWGPANEEIIARHPIDRNGSGTADLDRYIAVDVYRYLTE